MFREKKAPVLFSCLFLMSISFVYTKLMGPDLPFNFAVSLKMLAFFCVGHMFALWLPTIKESWRTGYGAFSFGGLLLVVASVIAWFGQRVDYAGDNFPSIPMFLMTSIIGSFGVCFLSMGIGKCKALEYVGRKTLPILVMHKFPVLLFQTVGPQKSILAQYNSFSCVIVAITVSLIAIVLCLAVDWCIVRICPLLYGDFSRYSRH